MAWWLASMAEPIGAGRMKGRLYDLGEYPALVFSRSSTDWVLGDIYKLLDPQHALEHLDGYEGEDFERVQATAYLHNGAAVSCWVYRYKGSPDPENLIASGDYFRKR